jgi:hypothetical protein
MGAAVGAAGVGAATRVAGATAAGLAGLAARWVRTVVALTAVLEADIMMYLLVGCQRRNALAGVAILRSALSVVKKIL